MRSVVASYEEIARALADKVPDASRRLRLLRDLIRNGRLVVDDVEYRLTAVRRLAAKAG